MYYGQNKEDEIINNLIVSRYGSDFKGSILDLGANDGVTLSNSRFFIENGWVGYLVEAGRNPFSLLERNYLNKSGIPINLYNVAIGNEDKFLTFYESNSLLSSNDIGLVSSLVSNETKRWRDSGIGYTEYLVPCLTWSSFVDKFNLHNTKFDVISIDIEGMDYDVLCQMNLNELGCKVLCIEFNGIEKEKYIEYTSKFGLSLVHENPENLIFVK